MFKIVDSADELERAFFVRGAVFVEEQGIPYTIDRDGFDLASIHVLGEREGEPVAAGRIRFVAAVPKIERLAVRKRFRGSGVGRALLSFVIEALEKQGFSEMKLHAQTYLEDFYRAHGFERTGDTFMEAGIEHCLMIRRAAKRPAGSQSAEKAGKAEIRQSVQTFPENGGAKGSRRCAVTGKEFTIEEEDLRFYEKMQVPPPVLCPDERALRRMAFANQRHLYHLVCKGSGKKIISNYAPQQDAPVYDIEFWYSDKWDQFATGREFDFNRPFFDQFRELISVAPRPNLQRNPQFDENSDFTNYAGKNKNCYLIFDSDKNRDCYYSYSINSCEDVVDCFRVERSELCYDCVDCTDCYATLYSQNCDNCSESSFLKNCIGCSNCFGCVNLRNKSYYFFNEKCTKDEYQRKLAELALDRMSVVSGLRSKVSEFARKFPLRSMQGIQNENVLGDYLTNCKNAYMCFDSRKLWDCRYVQQAFDDAKDCMDCTEVGDGVELLYESCYAGYGGHFMRFASHALGQSSHLTYCYFTPHCSECFGCVGVHHAKYSVLNRQYSEKDYRSLTERIIEHMKRTGEWGQFFPPNISPFPYNKTHAFDYFPLSKKDALARGYSWLEEDKKEYRPSKYAVPDGLKEVPDSVVDELLACTDCGKNYRVQRGELAFYRKVGVPIPRSCFDERHAARLRLRNPRTLYARKCAVSGKDLITAIAPDRPEKVFSEDEFAKALL